MLVVRVCRGGFSLPFRLALRLNCESERVRFVFPAFSPLRQSITLYGCANDLRPIRPDHIIQHLARQFADLAMRECDRVVGECEQACSSGGGWASGSRGVASIGRGGLLGRFEKEREEAEREEEADVVSVA